LELELDLKMWKENLLQLVVGIKLNTKIELLLKLWRMKREEREGLLLVIRERRFGFGCRDKRFMELWISWE